MSLVKRIGYFPIDFSNEPNSFLNVNTNQFMDSDIKRYVGGSGTSQLSATEPDNTFMPNSFVLHQNYPNPFNPVTRIKYDIAENSNVSVNVYNLMGEKVATLVNQYQNAGYYFTNWDSRNDLGVLVSAGVYLFVLDVGELRQVRKMILLK